MIGTILEWVAFGMVFVNVYCYGNSKLQGGITGIATSLVFIAWGLVTAVPAAWITNIAFLVIHTRNIRRGLNE